MQVLFHSTMVELDAQAADWQDAIRRSGELLVRAGAAEPSYVEAMVEMVEQVGAYIVVGSGVAIPHARPETGARRVALGLLRLSEPTVFPGYEENPVDVLLPFAGVDSGSHLDLIKGLASLLRDEQAMAKLRAVHSPAEVVEVLKPRFSEGGENFQTSSASGPVSERRGDR